MNRTHRIILLGVVAVIASLGLAGTAHAGTDPLKSGSVSWQLKGANRPRNLSLAVTGGDLDPISGAGNVIVSGKFRGRVGKAKAKVKLISLNFAANGGLGSITARVKGDRVSGFGTLRG